MRYAPRRGPPRPPGGRKNWTYVRKATQNTRLIRSSCQEQKQAQTELAAHNYMDVSAQINPEESSKCSNQFIRPLTAAIVVAACSNSPSLSHVLCGSCCYTTAIIAAQTEISCSFVPPVCVACALQGHRRQNNSRVTKDVKPLCQINALFPVRQRQPHQDSTRATESLLRAGVLILFLAENPRSHSVVCYIRII